MYRLVAIMSLLLRTCIFPNPFTGIFTFYFADTAASASADGLADLFNLTVGGGIMHVICYPLVGIIYERGSAPIWGAVLYAGAVLLNSLALSFISTKVLDFELMILLFVLFTFVEVVLLLGMRRLFERVRY